LKIKFGDKVSKISVENYIRQSEVCNSDCNISWKDKTLTFTCAKNHVRKFLYQIRLVDPAPLSLPFIEGANILEIDFNGCTIVNPSHIDLLWILGDDEIYQKFSRSYFSNPMWYVDMEKEFPSDYDKYEYYFEYLQMLASMDQTKKNRTFMKPIIEELIKINLHKDEN